MSVSFHSLLSSNEVEVVVHNAPTYPLAWNKFGDLDGAAVHVSVAVLEFAESVGPALILS